MRKLHPNQAEAIANALSIILEENKRASRVLENFIEEHPKWGARDRNLFMALCMTYFVGNDYTASMQV